MEAIDLAHPKAVAERGRKIYADNYKTAYELEHMGKLLAIDVLTGAAHLGDTAGEAFDAAHGVAPNRLFHLIRVDSVAAFNMRHTDHASMDKRLRC